MNIKVSLALRWSLGSEDGEHNLDPLVFALLRGVRQGGHLNFAAREAGVSYRHAWGLLRDWETRLGKPLLSARQGRGAPCSMVSLALCSLVTQKRFTYVTQPTSATSQWNGRRNADGVEAGAVLAALGVARPLTVDVVAPPQQRGAGAS